MLKETTDTLILLMNMPPNDDWRFEKHLSGRTAWERIYIAWVYCCI